MIMVIYEVTLYIQKKIFNDYQTWLMDHLKEMLTFDGFFGAEIFSEQNDKPNKEEYEKLIVQYRIKSEEQLKKYIDQHATAMRQQAITKFGDQFYAERRVLKLEGFL